MFGKAQDGQGSAELALDSHLEGSVGQHQWNCFCLDVARIAKSSPPPNLLTPSLFLSLRELGYREFTLVEMR